MEGAGGRQGARQSVGAALLQPMTGGTREGMAPREAHIMEQPFPEGHPGGIGRHVERQRHKGFL